MDHDTRNSCTPRGALLVNEPLLKFVEYVPPETLRRYSPSIRMHTRRKHQLLRNSIREYGGILVPLLVLPDRTLITGHARLDAAIAEGMTRVPVICISHLTDAQVRAFRIADNRLVERATWDMAALAIEFQAQIDFGIDPTRTGFEFPEIDLAIQAACKEAPAEENPFDSLRSGPPVSAIGCKWLMGGHAVLCGDLFTPHLIESLLGGRPVDMAFLDPPYNLSVKAVGGRGSIRHPEFAMASGEMTDAEQDAFVSDFLKVVTIALKDGALVFVCTDWRSASRVDFVARGLLLRALNWCIWVKNAPGQGSHYRSQHEIVLVYCYGEGRYLNNIQQGRFGRNRSNVWNYPGVVGFNRERRADHKRHPTPKPVAMVQDAILDCTRPRGVVLDTFLGGGATLIACERSGRFCRGMEIDPYYVDACVRRWQTETGGKAVCAATGLAFDDLARGAPPARLLLPAPFSMGGKR